MSGYWEGSFDTPFIRVDPAEVQRRVRALLQGLQEHHQSADEAWATVRDVLEGGDEPAPAALP